MHFSKRIFYSDTIIYDEYTPDTNMLVDIVHTAYLREIHSSILSPFDLIQNLEWIKMILPSGTGLSVGFSTHKTIKLLKLP